MGLQSVASREFCCYDQVKRSDACSIPGPAMNRITPEQTTVVRQGQTKRPFCLLCFAVIVRTYPGQIYYSGYDSLSTDYLGSLRVECGGAETSTVSETTTRSSGLPLLRFPEISSFHPSEYHFIFGLFAMHCYATISRSLAFTTTTTTTCNFSFLHTSHFSMPRLRTADKFMKHASPPPHCAPWNNGTTAGSVTPVSEASALAGRLADVLARHSPFGSMASGLVGSVSGRFGLMVIVVGSVWFGALKPNRW